MSFRSVVLMLVGIISVELLVAVGLPLVTSKIRGGTRSTLALMRSRMPTQADDLDDLLPPSVGTLYILQGSSSTFSKSVDHLRSLRQVLRHSKTNSSAAQEFLDGLDDADNKSMLALAHNRTGEFHALERYLIPSLAANSANQDLIEDDLRMLFKMGISAEKQGMMDDARLDFQQFVVNTYWASEKMSDIVTNVDLQREMSLAKIRIKLLSSLHVFRWQAFRDLDSGDVNRAKHYRNDEDQAIREIALFTIASNEFKSGKVDEAYTELFGHLPECGSIRDECEYLLARMHARRWFIRKLQDEASSTDPEEAIRLFRSFVDRVGLQHYLADDAYLSMATTLRDAGANKHAILIAKFGLAHTHGDTTPALSEFVANSQYETGRK